MSLIDQWCGEIPLFGLTPVNLTEAGNSTGRGRVLQKLRRQLRLGQSNVEVVLVSHDTLCTEVFKQAVAAFECERLLIADEAHNLGRENFVSDPPKGTLNNTSI